MNIEEFRFYCLSFSGTSESLPFNDNTLVFKVCNKMFALTDINSFSFINLKCNPEKAVELREKYSAVTPGFHMNKKHWNSIKMDHSITDKLIKEWIKDSFILVVSNLPNKIRKKLS